MDNKLDALLSEAALPTAPAVRAAIIREWDRLSGPGTVLTGAQRVHVASLARAWSDPEKRGGIGSGPVARAAGGVRLDAHGINEEFIADLEKDGLSRVQFAEIIAVVARLSAVDFYMTGIGTGLLPIPSPFDGEPSGNIDARAELSVAWIPTVPGSIGAPTILLALPDESHALFDLHEALYLSEREMRSNDFERPLLRQEMELMASRTSFLNECFY